MLTEKQIEWMKDQMDDTAGSLVQPKILANQIQNITKEIFETYCDPAECETCPIPEFKLSELQLEEITEVESDSGMLVKDSTLKYIIEKLVNELILHEQKICADGDG